MTRSKQLQFNIFYGGNKDRLKIKCQRICFERFLWKGKAYSYQQEWNTIILEIKEYLTVKCFDYTLILRILSIKTDNPSY